MNSTLQAPLTPSNHVPCKRHFRPRRSALCTVPLGIPPTLPSSPSAYMLPSTSAFIPAGCSKQWKCRSPSSLRKDPRSVWLQPRQATRAHCQADEHSKGSGLIVHQSANQTNILSSSPGVQPSPEPDSISPTDSSSSGPANGSTCASQNGKEPSTSPAQQQQQPQSGENVAVSSHDCSMSASGSDSEREGTSIISSIRDSSGTGPPTSNSLQGVFSLPSVPWGMRKIVQVMVLWLLAYVIIGQVAVPMALCVFGLDRDALGLRGHAVLHLCLDLSQLAVTLAILWGCLKKYKPRSRGLFPMSWRGWWPLVVLAACVVFPGVDWIAQQSLSWFPVEAAESWTNQMETSLSVGDWITNVAYFSVVSICAPIWEEAIFRGFLLTSLGRYMSPQWAVAASSLLFAMCHFRLQTFLPLLVLGVVFSFVFLLTRNLLPPMVLHSVWNVFVLANLLLRPG